MRIALRATVATLVTGLVVALGFMFWQFWWVPKTEFSCDGLPNGASTSMIHRGVLWCDLRLVEPQDGWILAVGVLIRPGCPGGCRFHCGGLLVLSVGRWFGGYWGQPGWRDQMRVQALTRSSAQAQSSGSFKIW